MNIQFEDQIKRILRKARLQKQWHRAVRVMAGIVVLSVVASLTLAAITMERKPLCGMEEHEHSEECYREEWVLICGHDTVPVDESILPEIPNHDDTGTKPPDVAPPLESIPEIPEELPNEESNPEAAVPEPVLICGLEEKEGHTHVENCYTETSVLTCELPEDENHTHGDGCYTTEQVLTCDLPEEPGHTHDESCYEMPQSEETTAETLLDSVLSVFDGAASEPQPAPDEPEPTPTEPEPAPAEPEPTPTEPEAAPTEPESSGQEETAPEALPETSPEDTETDPHIHTGECFELQRVLVCGKQEHVHSDSCYEKSDSTADVEAPTDWEATMNDVVISGDWAKDTIAAAQTQIGYQESKLNFIWDEQGNKMGYTRYGDWYGSKYGHWCAMFVSFCLHYGGMPDTALPFDPSCSNWAALLESQDLYQMPGTYTPLLGDPIFLDLNDDGKPDHVGLVEAVDMAEDGTPLMIHTIEGNVGDGVKRHKYEPADQRIDGYCPLAEVKVRFENLNPAGVLHYTYEDERLTGAVTITGQQLPLAEDTRLVITECTQENQPEAYQTAMHLAGETSLEPSQTLSGFSVFDVQLYSGETPQTISPEAVVEVDVQFRQPLFLPELVQTAAALRTFVLEKLLGLPAEAPATVPKGDAVVSDPILEESEAAPQAMLLSEPVVPLEETTAEQTEPVPSHQTTTSEEVESSYGGTAEGVTNVKYTSRGLSPFAVMLTNQTQSGEFWKEVRHGEKLEKGQTYMIVSAEGGFALTNNGGKVFTKLGPNYTPVQLQPVKGNPGYYTVPNAPETVKWKYNEVLGANASPRLTQMYKGKECFINPAFPAYLFVPEGNAGPLKFNNSGALSCFHIENWKQNKYVSIDTMTSGFTGVAEPYSNNDIRDTDMLMLKMVDTTLTIPDDAVDESGGTGQIGSATKPHYPVYVTPSDQKTGSYEDEVDKVDYYSDPSTTRLEQYFGYHPLNGGNDFNAQKGDNGKAMMDKSVIYGHDDYGAFNQYADGTFSTTLSALGQAFVVDQSTTKVPIDVLLILDMSNSMNETDAGQSKCRAKILVEAINKTMTNIMAAHPENRVCAVSYNSGAYDLLNLGHHLPDWNGKFFEYTVGANNEFGHPRISIQATGLSSHVGGKIACEKGTYTQMGIAKGYELLMRNTPNPSDTTYTTTVNGQTVTKPRKPVIILVSDGEPTHCTNHYTDVLNNPYYGDGLGPVSNAKGAQGYYTILSANYFKRMVGIHYDNPAAMYTIAFGMKEGDYKQNSEGSAATNHYRATVMNPTQTNINNLLNAHTTNSNQVEKALNQMLNGSYSSPYQEVGMQLDLIPSMGKPHVNIPILKQNPYRGNYAYADKAYLGNTGNSGLDAAFDEIIKLNTVYDFSYETQASKPLILSDPIGEGMEVKGDPVLRVNGTNYAHTGKQTQGNATLYTYSGVVPMDPYSKRTVDLATIKVRVETVNGKQTVKMDIPPKSLPTYTADSTMSFYYEALPIRLIYQVGLSTAGQAEIDNLQPGQTKVFYTNRYTVSDHANGTLEPSDKNPYYKKGGWQLNNTKTHNTTGTDGWSLIKNGSAQKVNYNLGNNGKLVITKKIPAIVPADPVSVEKKWQNYDGTEMTDLSKLPEITFTLYRTYTDESGQEIRETVAENVKLNTANGWKHTFTAEELNAVPGRVYKYYVTEAAVEGYNVSYSGDGILTNTPENPIVITNRSKYSEVVLPSTGGSGTAPYLISGMLLMAACIVYQCVIRPKRGERGKA